ncbi:hypothetical protein [Actinoplanes siamensis]|uniref:Uncharacterized protein n=1 Tax=Actinoplanes siamensis TaxID=1223317 RepID=A0A919TKD8_9ACTN|nr:hypothetical protein [Actinoplanes siamensis]GIF05482.1 hypothetical protein Asi03nite_30200 [Actinoplanes siamensis]
MPELPAATLAVAWLSESRSPAVAAFVRTAREVAEARDGRLPWDTAGGLSATASPGLTAG